MDGKNEKVKVSLQTNDSGETHCTCKFGVGMNDDI